MASEALNRKLRGYIQDIQDSRINEKHYPGAVIGAECGHLRKVDKSGPVPNPLAPKLTRALCLIGPLGTKVDKTYVGCCCEVSSSNQILNPHQNIPIGRIRFTEAKRPRTNQVVNRCSNCRIVFG
jgi:hypothetical protein